MATVPYTVRYRRVDAASFKTERVEFPPGWTRPLSKEEARQKLKDSGQTLYGFARQFDLPVYSVRDLLRCGRQETKLSRKRQYVLAAYALGLLP